MSAAVLLMMVSFVAPEGASTPCAIARVGWVSPQVIEVVFTCDLDPNTYVEQSMVVKGDGDVIPARRLAFSRLSFQPTPSFTGILFRLDSAMKPDVAYVLHYSLRGNVHGNDAVAIEGKKEVSNKGTITVDRLTRRLLVVTFPGAVDPTSPPTVTVKREGTDLVIEAAPPKPSGSGKGLLITLARPLQHGDSLNVTTKAPDGTVLQAGMEKVDFGRPSDRKSAGVYVSVSAEAGEYQKPNVALDLKLNLRRPLASWIQGPNVDATVATQDSNGTNKAVLGWSFERLTLLDKPGVVGVVLGLAPTAEFDKGLANRSGVLELKATAVLPNWQHFTFSPDIGIEVGRNFGLKKEYRQFEDYGVARAKVALYAAWAWNLTPRGPLGIQRISFSLRGVGRILGREEIDSTVIPPGERTDPEVKATYALDDNSKYFGAASLDVKLGDYYGVALEYSKGQRPLLYEDENKVTLKLTYMF